MEGSGCNICPAYKKCTAVYRSSRCAHNRATYGVESDPFTNADRIRSMSDEELAACVAGIMMLSVEAVARYFGVEFDDDELNEYIKDLAREFAKELKKPIEN